MEMPQRRSGHVAVSYKDHIIVWGGYNEQQFMNSKDIWLYEINKHIWKKILSHGKMPPVASGSCAALLESSLYIFAGFSVAGDGNSMHILNLKTFEWTKPDIQTLKPSPRNKLGCWVTGDKIIFFGGYGQRSTLSQNFIGKGTFVADESQWLLNLLGWNNDMLLYDTVKNEWLGLPVDDTVPSPRAAHSCATLENDVGFLYGGRHKTKRLDDLYTIALDSYQWTEIIAREPKPNGRSWHSLSAVDDKHLFLFGGLTTDGKVLGDGWLFSTNTNKWKNVQYLESDAKRWHTSCQGIYQGQIIIFGGCQSKLYEDEVHLDEVTTFQLSPLPLLKLAVNAVAKFKEKTRQFWPDLPEELKTDLVQLTGGEGG